ncbi:branched-chain amino acid ABC transporter permease [Alphaproteobacteria bacterium]|jgi:ABC-type branched-subunit amino acid transport system permease subunit|nr:branched-chain amino acid ABC transporter permease [Alphaproteobacteria bacterium]MDB9871915.1 branched-chain amino acid ABC transporter permease [Alphaproteobacteria bacterium]|tara:strand:+ start:2505 stop:3470 length:966 start_codon:yes stop_codon:yes gene_type:complete
MTHKFYNNLIVQSIFLMSVLIIVGLFIPNWLVFVITKAIAYGLVALGIVTLMRGGLVSFGQGFVFAIGGYTAGLLGTQAGLTDAVLLLFISFLFTGFVGLIFGPLLARYRDIFFAMLSLAFSMVLYGVLIKIDAIGGSDGFVLPESTYFGILPSSDYADYALYVVSIILTGIVSVLLRYYYNSTPGLIALAVRENELRVEYLGASAFRVTVLNFTIAAGLGGMGGALNGIALGHIDPEFSYWTTSGEFVFISILAGYLSVPAVFLAALLLELVRSFSGRYFPDTWQLILGVFLILSIIYIPTGIGSFFKKFMDKLNKKKNE